MVQLWYLSESLALKITARILISSIWLCMSPKMSATKDWVVIKDIISRNLTTENLTKIWQVKANPEAQWTADWPGKCWTTYNSFSVQIMGDCCRPLREIPLSGIEQSSWLLLIACNICRDIIPVCKDISSKGLSLEHDSHSLPVAPADIVQL